jgi:hypothetical protein
MTEPDEFSTKEVRKKVTGLKDIDPKLRFALENTNDGIDVVQKLMYANEQAMRDTLKLLGMLGDAMHALTIRVQNLERAVEHKY